MNKLVFSFCLISLCWGCAKNSPTEKYQNKRNNIINVKDKIKEIVIEDALIGNFSWPYLMNEYLIIRDYGAANEQIHILDRENYKYITSTGSRGQGPGEIARIGHIATDEINRRFFATDMGRLILYCYEVDSILANPNYQPTKIMNINEKSFPDTYKYINDTLSIGVIIEPIGNNNFKPHIGKWNMKTGEIKLIGYENPQIRTRRIWFDISIEHGLYVECYHPYDLMTICNLDGELKFNIYGPRWSEETSRTRHYQGVLFCGDKIAALYYGEESLAKDKKMKFEIFDLEGNYIKTLETGYYIYNLFYDELKNRIIMSMNDEIQFGYLDLDDILD